MLVIGLFFLLKSFNVKEIVGDGSDFDRVEWMKRIKMSRK
jgi:hypothetical protein